MCGIVGFFGDGDRALLERMNDAIAHRGPDGQGVLLAPPVGLAMRRLAIIDPAGGDQPIFSENGRMAIVFNGELYNYRELRAAHLAGYRFGTSSDTEVVLHLYQELGEAAFTLLNGMYAFALWDGDRRRLYLVRDRVGVKPLYLHDNTTGRHGDGPRRLTFASELKALLQDPGIARRLSPEGLQAYLAWQYVPGPDTILAGVTKLPPGHFMRLEAGETPVLQPYWQARDASTGPSPSRPADFQAVLRGAVRRQLVADVPVGAFLSGGVDSSLVVALMREVTGQERLQTFTAGFTDSHHDESPWAARVAAHLGVEHTIVRLDASALDEVPCLARALDEPVADRAALPTLLLSRVARASVKVVLTGEGSDELFGGYPRYRLEEIARRFHRMPLANRRGLWQALVGSAPAAWRPRLAKVLLSSADPAARREAWVANFDQAARSRLVLPEWVRSLRPETPPMAGLKGQLLLDQRTWLVDNVLMKVDKMTMAASLEARVPFLDHEVVDWALALPATAKAGGRGGKRVVRDAAARLLPEAIMNRPKRAFNPPTDDWLRAPAGQTLLVDSLLDHTATGRGYFSRAEVERLIGAHAAGTNHGQALWNLLIFEWWLRAYIDK